ncbi:MAG TPA: zinc ribbon domain-containing protein, partial [Candidatus Anoxymicrobiaceae bacterium]
MPAAAAAYGFWSDQKVLFSVIFGILFLAFAALLVFVYTRKPVEAVAGPVPSGPKFCEQCGTKLATGEHFCTNCGAPV